MPTPNALNILTNMESFEYRRSSTVSPPPQYAVPQQERRLEEMSEEEQFQLAVRESIATASPVRASGRPQAFSTGSPDPTYTLHSTDARAVPYMSGAVGTRRAELEDSSGAFGATPLSNLPRAGTENVPRAELESVELQFREDPSGMTEEEMVERAIAESMRIF